MASRAEVRNSLTEECERFTMEEPSVRTMVIKLEHRVRSAYSWSSQRHSVFNFGILSASPRSTARTSASSTRRGKVSTARQCSRRVFGSASWYPSIRARMCSPKTLVTLRGLEELRWHETNRAVRDMPVKRVFDISRIFSRVLLMTDWDLVVEQLVRGLGRCPT